ncbi:hypothetical protein B7P43_G10451 [Cryptotermes secundus]|uniref:Tc1-like transposase DDE domain-containing protein n=1 Tax=Cryptotermes secundus TaxID=105785 RepID=A0A2J7RL96_9NEOP|nr:hypothetical protein B7P43_G10451 [Cryptotermes secundus]
MGLKGTRFATMEDIKLNATAELRKISKGAFHRCFQQWQDRWSKCVDNARVYAAQAVADLFDQWGWEVLYHPPYSLDLSPCDFDLIPKMKEPLCGIRFRTVPEILQAVDCSIRTINTTGAAKGRGLITRPRSPTVCPRSRKTEVNGEVHGALDRSGQLPALANLLLGKVPGTKWTGGWVSQSWSGCYEEEKYLALAGDRASAVQPAAHFPYQV